MKTVCAVRMKQSQIQPIKTKSFLEVDQGLLACICDVLDFWLDDDQALFTFGAVDNSAVCPLFCITSLIHATKICHNQVHSMWG